MWIILNRIQWSEGKAYTETKFLGREPGEFRFTQEQEGRIVGQCAVGLVRRLMRYRHRADVSFVLLKECWDMGIGGRMRISIPMGRMRTGGIW